jgi:hypothetical protein
MSLLTLQFIQLFSYVKLDVADPVHAASYTPFNLKIQAEILTGLRIDYLNCLHWCNVARVGHGRNTEKILILKHDGKKLLWI